MIELRIHLYEHGGRVLCGHPHHRNLTIDPKKVTCKNCKRLMAGEVE